MIEDEQDRLRLKRQRRGVVECQHPLRSQLHRHLICNFLLFLETSMSFKNGYLANPHVAFLPNPSMPSEVAPHPAVQSVAPPTDRAYVPESQMDDETIYRKYILNIHD